MESNLFGDRLLMTARRHHQQQPESLSFSEDHQMSHLVSQYRLLYQAKQEQDLSTSQLLADLEKWKRQVFELQAQEVQKEAQLRGLLETQRQLVAEIETLKNSVKAAGQQMRGLKTGQNQRENELRTKIRRLELEVERLERSLATQKSHGLQSSASCSTLPRSAATKCWGVGKEPQCVRLPVNKSSSVVSQQHQMADLVLENQCIRELMVSFLSRVSDRMLQVEQQELEDSMPTHPRRLPTINWSRLLLDSWTSVQEDVRRLCDQLEAFWTQPISLKEQQQQQRKKEQCSSPSHRDQEKARIDELEQEICRLEDLLAASETVTRQQERLLEAFTQNPNAHLRFQSTRIGEPCSMQSPDINDSFQDGSDREDSLDDPKSGCEEAIPRSLVLVSRNSRADGESSVD